MKTTPLPRLLILGIVACVTAGAVAYLIFKPSNPATKTVGPATANVATENPGEKLQYDPTPLGSPARGHPIITHVEIADLDQDGLPDIIACDAEANSVRWLRQSPRGVFTEQALGDPIKGPVHASVCDINGDGRPDLLIASMGIVFPNNDRIGSVVALENQGGGKFTNHVVIENIARVTDVRGADMNSDGKIDLVVGQFGYVQGEIRWMENLGDWQFRSHILLNESGTIHTPVADYDGDGHLDFAALIAQDSEAIHLFAGNGKGDFRDTVLWNSNNAGWASSGLTGADINRDGRPDLVFSNGDAFDGDANLPAWHGLQWLENRGGGLFNYHRIGNFPGCYGPACIDLNGDGFTDILTVSAFNEWLNPASVSMMAWLNNGTQNFHPVVLAHTPTHLITVAAGDLDGDGIPEIVTGGFNVYPPYSEMSRITLWTRQKSKP